MKNWIKSSLIFACFAGVVAAIGFFNFKWIQKNGVSQPALTPLSELAVNSGETVDLPFDISKLGNTMLSCTNKGTAAKNLVMDFLTTAGGAAYTLPIKKGATVINTLKILQKS